MKIPRRGHKKPQIQIMFGLLLRRCRLNSLLTQEKLGELADVHFTYISSVERGERNISLVSMDKLALAMNCSLKELMPY